MRESWIGLQTEPRSGSPSSENGNAQGNGIGIGDATADAYTITTFAIVTHQQLGLKILHRSQLVLQPLRYILRYLLRLRCPDRGQGAMVELEVSKSSSTVHA